MTAEQLRIIPARDPEQILVEAIARHNTSKGFVLFSGGKDSSVTLDYLWRKHREIVTGALHLNTGIGLQSTRDFAREFCSERNIPFYQAFTPISYEDLVRQGWWDKKRKIRHNGFPGPAAHLFAYTWLKQRALEAFLSLYRDGRGDPIMLMTGVRAEESERRMGTCVDVEANGSQIWVAPLIDYSQFDMQRHRTYYSVPMSPSSQTLHISGECLCGAFGHRSELDLIGKFYDDQSIPRILGLEKEMEAKGVARCRWATDLPGDKAFGGKPRLCTDCYKNPLFPIVGAA